MHSWAMAKSKGTAREKETRDEWSREAGGIVGDIDTGHSRRFVQCAGMVWLFWHTCSLCHREDA